MFERYIHDGQFGNVHKHVVLNLEGVTEEQYNKAIKDADEEYSKLEHITWYDSACHVA